MSLFENAELNEIIEAGLEKSLLLSACSHINNFNDPFRANVFALLMRELVRIMMDRRASDEMVRSASWCKGEPWLYVDGQTGEQKVTRRARYRYAMTGPLSDGLLQRHPQLNCATEISELVKTIGELSKYAHISNGTHTLSPTQSADLLHFVEGVIEDFAKKFVELRHRVRDIVGGLVDEELNQHLMEAIPNELDELSSQTRVEEVRIEHLEEFDFRCGSPTLSGSGYAEIELSYGGSDGFTAPDSYPLEFEVFIDPETLAVKVETVTVVTDSFYE